MAVTAEKGEAATHPEMSRGDGAAGGRAEAGQLLCCGKAAPPFTQTHAGGASLSALRSSPNMQLKFRQVDS